jgi:hypothetical protein
MPWLRLRWEITVVWDERQPLESMVCAVMPKPFCTTRRLPALSKMIPRGCVKSLATLTAFQPFAVSTGEWKSLTPAHDVGMPDWIGPGVVVGITLVVRVLDCVGVGVGVELGRGVLVESGINAFATNLSKFAFLPWDKSRLQCPKLECTLNVDRLFAGSLGSLLARPCAKGRAGFVVSSDTVLPSVSCH